MTNDTLSRRVARASLQRFHAGAAPALAAKTRLHIADSVGIALAATRDTAWAAKLADGVGAGASGRAATMLPGVRLPPAEAAFVNAALVHALDFDDIHDRARLHPTTVTLPAALAAADRRGGDRGREVVAAVAEANEFLCRLGVACSPTGTGPGSDWFLTQLLGYLAAALSAGLVLGLDEGGLVSALGFAYMQAAGGKEAGFGVGSNARSLYPAFAAMGGTQAACLAHAGLVGPASALDGAAGFFRLYLGSPLDGDRAARVIDDGPSAFAATDVKPWPCCRLSHPYVASAFAAREALGGREPRRIVVAVNASAEKLCRPLADRRRPVTLQDAKYSIPFMTAFALAHGRVDLGNLGDAALQDARVLALASRVELDPRLPDNPGHPPAEIDVEVETGALVHAAALPASLDEPGAHAKFRHCLAHLGRAAGADGLWEALLAPDGLDGARLEAALAAAA